MTDDLNACAALVEKADPDRFRATMAAPVPARRILFPLYAFNAEVARAPWVTSEPMLAEIRLQWWRDALSEIAAKGPARRHEVVTPLATFLTPDMAEKLDELISARYWDIDTDPFRDGAELTDYLAATSGHLHAVAGQALGALDPDPFHRFGLASGIANWLTAVPDLLARGRHPLPDSTPQAIAALAQQGLTNLAIARAASIPKPARPALLAGWLAPTLLKRAIQDPARVLTGTLHPSPARARITLIRQSLTGHF